MNKIRETVNRNIKGNKVLRLFVITNLVYIFMLLILIPNVMDFSNGMKLLEIMPAGYNAEYVRSLFEALGEKGRDSYMLNQVLVEMFYPFLFGISYCLLLAYLLNILNKLDSALFYLCLLPLLAGVFDFLESIGIIIMLIEYPKFFNLLAMTTNIFTILKSVSATICFIVLLIMLVAVGIGVYKKKNK